MDIFQNMYDHRYSKEFSDGQFAQPIFSQLPRCARGPETRYNSDTTLQPRLTRNSLLQLGLFHMLDEISFELDSLQESGVVQTAGPAAWQMLLDWNTQKMESSFYLR